MAKVNVPKRSTEKTHEGAPAKLLRPEAILRRSVMACMLWEDEFYEDGESIAERIADCVARVKPEKVAEIAVEAREKMNLRHVPLLLVRELARQSKKMKSPEIVSSTLARIIQRADELTEFLAIYWKDGRQPLSAQVKKGLAAAFAKFDAYQLAKYDRDGAVKLKDVLALCHAKPQSETQSKVWKQLIEGTLPPPDTWEVESSKGKLGKADWEGLISRGKLPAFALIRNLRNMEGAGVCRKVIARAMEDANFSRLLPFRFVSAAKAVPKLEDIIDKAMLRTLSQVPKLRGKTVVVIDVSGSMYHSQVSKRSDMTRALAACALGAILREVCENPCVYATAGNDSTRQHKTAPVPSRRGMALVDTIFSMCIPLGGGGIFLTPVCRHLSNIEKDVDRMIVITDEQDCAVNSADSPLKAQPLGKPGSNYLINVASYDKGIGYDKWVHIDGWSEAVVRYICERESDADASHLNSQKS